MLGLLAIVFVAIALLCGGKLKNIAASPIRALWLPILSFALNTAAGIVCTRWLPREPWFAIILSLSYAASLAFVLFNLRPLLFSTFALAGIAANLSVIALNDFYMPVSANVLARPDFAGIPESLRAAYRIADETTRLRILGDIIFIPAGRLSGLASIGDVALAISVFFLVFYLLKPQSKMFRQNDKENAQNT